MFHKEADELIVEGFPTFALAREYARRRVRDSLEELRQPHQTAEKLRAAWYAMGEDAIVPGKPFYSGASELDHFITHPAAPNDRDWMAIERDVGVISKKFGA